MRENKKNGAKDGGRTPAADRGRHGDDVIPLTVLTIAIAVALVMYVVWIWPVFGF